MKLKRFQKVSLVDGIEAKVINPLFPYCEEHDSPLCTHDEPYGYRLTDGRRPAFWFVVPSYMIKECNDR